MDLKVTKDIQEVLGKLKEELGYEKPVILYGSYSRGEETDGSDLDISVPWDSEDPEKWIKYAEKIVNTNTRQTPMFIKLSKATPLPILSTAVKAVYIKATARPQIAAAIIRLHNTAPLQPNVTVAPQAKGTSSQSHQISDPLGSTCRFVKKAKSTTPKTIAAKIAHKPTCQYRGFNSARISARLRIRRRIVNGQL